jgi:RimJ/RimL family protein N-acetyltransferase
VIWPPAENALKGSIVRLEPLAPEHRGEMWAAAQEPETWAWMNRLIPGSEAEFGAWFEDRLAASRGGSEWCFATRSAETDELVGSSSYLNVRPEHAGLEIGWTWLHPAAWRTGANVEAKLLMLGQAFDDLAAMRVEFKTDARNERSRAALAALPATFEGVFRKHMLMPGIGERDSAYFSITDAEWPDVRANLERRLAAGRRETAHA